jgi:hypothetical protein
MGLRACSSCWLVIVLELSPPSSCTSTFLLQGSLWPGGVWFQYLPQYQRASLPPSEGSGLTAHARQISAMQADKYLEPG